MMPPCIGEKHPRAAHPVDQIKKTNQRWRKTRQRFFFAQIQKGGDSI